MEEPARFKTPLDWALRYWNLGWNPLAAPTGSKRPSGAWKRWQTERMQENEVRRQFADDVERSIWLPCGKVSQLVVLDCDSDEGEAHWAARIDLHKTACVRTAKGHHFYFRLEKDQEVDTWSGQGFDIRAEGAGVIAPPSTHASGSKYEWVRGPEHLRPMPENLLREKSSIIPHLEQTTDTLDFLLENRPAEGERNNWLARVAGMYALRTPDFHTFKIAVQSAASGLGLEPEEVAKLIKSIWDAERSKTANQELPTRKSGYLASGEKALLCLTSTKGGQSVDLWADADIIAKGVTEGGDGRVFDVDIVHAGRETSTQLDTKTLADNRRLLAWFMEEGIHQINPPGSPKLGIGTMLCAYLDSQNPPTFEAVNHLGWHDASGSYITNEGRITVDGLLDYEGVKPSLDVRKAAHHYKYGMGGRDEARECLAETLTFHEELAVASIAAWWCAHFLKAQLMGRFKLFPICEVTAASESGKTTGFIPLLMQLGGAEGPAMGEVTVPGFRDAMAVHEGIVRVDDKGDLTPIKDLLRTAPMGGVSTKKAGPGWTQQVEIEAHAAILITGQGLGIGKEKAVVDRVVAVELGNPSKRMSLRNEAEPQLTDVIAMGERLKRSGGFGGEFLREALRWWERNQSDVKVGAGRMANKHAIMRVGARILCELVRDQKWYEIVEKQLQSEIRDDTGEDALTLDIIPYVVGKLGFISKPTKGFSDYDPPTPILYADEQFWFHAEHLSSWLYRDLGRRYDERIHSKEGITQMAKVLGLGGPVGVTGGRRNFKNVTTGQVTKYWSTWKYSKDILDRIEGGSDGTLDV